ncbi:hypothetical protein EW145_g6920 [Phellinidium pouzarii]|uniref:Uncharacterized protein n=1 Tax=Phellinidium pouzarii TaxID=167371 RepID=A0A4V3XBB3_9AGAM|nr:hypothetical protein EW145_g6920 [Phellinidium pouzarii]
MNRSSTITFSIFCKITSSLKIQAMTDIDDFQEVSGAVLEPAAHKDDSDIHLVGLIGIQREKHIDLSVSVSAGVFLVNIFFWRYFAGQQQTIKPSDLFAPPDQSGTMLVHVDPRGATSRLDDSKVIPTIISTMEDPNPVKPASIPFADISPISDDTDVLFRGSSPSDQRAASCPRIFIDIHLNRSNHSSLNDNPVKSEVSISSDKMLSEMQSIAKDLNRFSTMYSVNIDSANSNESSIVVELKHVNLECCFDNIECNIEDALESLKVILQQLETLSKDNLCSDTSHIPDSMPTPLSLVPLTINQTKKQAMENPEPLLNNNCTAKSTILKDIHATGIDQHFADFADGLYYFVVTDTLPCTSNPVPPRPSKNTEKKQAFNTCIRLPKSFPSWHNSLKMTSTPDLSSPGYPSAIISTPRSFIPRALRASSTNIKVFVESSRPLAIANHGAVSGTSPSESRHSPSQTIEAPRHLVRPPLTDIETGTQVNLVSPVPRLARARQGHVHTSSQDKSENKTQHSIVPARTRSRLSTGRARSPQFSRSSSII